MNFCDESEWPPIEEVPPIGPLRFAPDRHVPWQLWVVVVMLGLEGLGNLFTAFDHPIALWWLTAKVLFVTGLLKGWKWVFFLFIVVAAYHALGFFFVNPIATFLNAIMVVLTVSARGYFWKSEEQTLAGETI